MPIAALYDIHGNLPALDAVLEDVRRSNADRIVVGGDVVPGPMPRECLRRLLDLDLPVEFIHGNCELAVLAQMAAGDGTPSYWGSTSGNPTSTSDQENMRWTAHALPEFEPLFASWPKTLRLEIDGLGTVLFCHGTPRSEVEIVLKTTAEAKLLPIYEPLGVDVVICGHTHMQFDRRAGRTRIVNAGSVGLPFGARGAFWALLGPDVEHRRTDYDVPKAAERFSETQYPGRQRFAKELLEPAGEETFLELFAKAEVK